MNLSCGTCERTLTMPYISDHTVALSTGFTSGWAINVDAILCPACATAFLANSMNEAGSVA